MPLKHSYLEFGKKCLLDFPYPCRAYYLGVYKRNNKPFHFFASGDVKQMRAEVQAHLIPVDTLSVAEYYPLTFIFPKFDSHEQGLLKDLHSFLNELISSDEFRRNVN